MESVSKVFYHLALKIVPVRFSQREITLIINRLVMKLIKGGLPAGLPPMVNKS